MSRTLPSALRAAALASQTPECVLEFLTISHADLATPIYVVNNTAAVTRGGQSYLPFAFGITLPAESESELGNARLVVDAVDLSFIEAIRSIETAVDVAIVVALASDPDSTELDLGSFKWKNLEWDKSTIAGDLTYEDCLDVLIPGDCMTPDNTPGAF